MMFKKSPTLKKIIHIYLSVIFIFLIFRTILFFSEIKRIDIHEDGLWTIVQAYIMGLRFDLVITGYITILPALVLFVFEIVNKRSRWVELIIFYWLFFLFSISFIICAADVPYFNQFFTRFSVRAFDWMDDPKFVFSMILQEPKYFLIALPLIILIIAFYKILKRIFRKEATYQNNPLILKITVAVLTICLIFIGIRGRLQLKSPIRTGTAYFCNNSFLNQLGLNPVFTLVHSYIEEQKNKTYHFIDDNTAIQNVQNWLNIHQQIYNSPIARNVCPNTLLNTKPNIVLIIMESMSAAKMGRFGNPDNLTPFLDSLSYQSYFFKNIYSAGIHTHNGIFGTLFSFPSLFGRHNMKTINKYYGIASVLRSKGYSTTYFTTHDGQFDNVEGFLRANDFENVISQSNYPAHEVKSTLGVPDDYMFRFSLPIIDKLYSQQKPFFVTFMTASDHGPYMVPEYFHPHSKEITKQTVEYADWSLKLFLDSASKKRWFANTIFVFIADHGAPIHATYDISLDYHHIPLLIYSPQLLQKPKTFDCIGGQIDVFPTLMGILNVPYINNTLGIDLLREKRPYIFMNDDDKTGVIDSERFLIFYPNGTLKLYKYRNNDVHDFSNEENKKAKEMEAYAKCNLQVFQYMLRHENTLPLPVLLQKKISN